jgi:hypothetical protein
MQSQRIQPDDRNIAETLTIRPQAHDDSYHESTRKDLSHCTLRQTTLQQGEPQIPPPRP